MNAATPAATPPGACGRSVVFLAPKGTLWAEVWRFEAVNTSTAPACDSPAALQAHLRRWDSDLRTNYRRALDEAQHPRTHI